MFLDVKEFTGSCPTCKVPLGFVPVTAVNTAYTAPALGMLKGHGHLVVRTGQSWQVRCAADPHGALRPNPGMVPVADQEAVKPTPEATAKRR